jgi:cytochrome c oxidase subunit 4
MSQSEHGNSGHATVGTYLAIAAVLGILTVVEVGVFYVPAFKPVLAPTLLLMSAIKFALVVMFYMHLKFDHKLFSLVFLLPFFIAISVIIALLFLFGFFRLG